MKEEKREEVIDIGIDSTLNNASNTITSVNESSGKCGDNLSQLLAEKEHLQREISREQKKLNHLMTKEIRLRERLNIKTRPNPFGHINSTPMRVSDVFCTLNRVHYYFGVAGSHRTLCKEQYTREPSEKAGECCVEDGKRASSALWKIWKVVRP